MLSDFVKQKPSGHLQLPVILVSALGLWGLCDARPYIKGPLCTLKSVSMEWR